jgi:hypothetical protein
MAVTGQGWQSALGRIARPIWYLGDNRVSQVGVMLTTASAVTIVTFFTTEFFGVPLGPYVGILAFLVLPAVFLAGLVLIPAGIWWRRRREVRAGRLPVLYPPIDLGNERARGSLWFLAIMTGLNVVLFLTVSYRAVHQMESVQFCGLTCHVVMQPEYTAYKDGAHARVPCVDCHIGPGAPWFVRSKLSGSYQVLAVTLNLYPRPIPTPIENLRPSRETCERCHWPEKFLGDTLVVKRHFGDDEIPEETASVLLMRTGGIHPLTGAPLGNHGVHLQPGAEIHYYATDARRQEIGYVRYRRPDGEVVEYLAPDAKPPPDPKALRRMDCMDCHNRPSHTFQLPGAAVDAAISAGEIDRTLPFVRKRALELLQTEYASREAAARAIRDGFHAFYREARPERAAAIARSADTIVGIHARNVFPAMRVTWGTYPNNLGHEDFPGCFRCHDGSHTSADDRTIAADCDTCHALLAVEEAEPEVLKLLVDG